MITVFATYRNQDMTEGRGPMVLDKVFMVQDDAEAYILQQDGVMGRKPSDFGKPSWEGMGDWKVEPLVIHESLADLEEFVFNENLEAAFAKLTPAEKAAVEAHIRAALT